MRTINTQRVVITGAGAVSPYGANSTALYEGLWQNTCALTQLAPSKALQCTVGGRIPPLPSATIKSIARESRRSMSPMSVYATLASIEALTAAQFSLEKLNNTPMGVSIGSTLGSPEALHEFFHAYITTGTLDSIRSTTFFKFMGHSVASNVAMALGLKGRLLAPAAACASGLVALGMGYESIAYGHENIMLCGGADEFHILSAATFDKMQASSTQKTPSMASLPFDTQRSGVVVSEGVGVLVLESLQSALSRKAPILAEISAYASTTSAQSMAHPMQESMQECMQKALSQAQLFPKNMDYINAHATATIAGDMAEGLAIEHVFGAMNIPTSSLKGHLGHTLGASGSIESIACIHMLKKQELLPTLHLQNIDEQCGKLDHIRHIRPQSIRHCMKNSFAMGGVNASMIFSQYIP